MKKKRSGFYWNTVLLGKSSTEGLNSNCFTTMKAVAKWIPVFCWWLLLCKVQNAHSCCSNFMEEGGVNGLAMAL